MYKIRKVGNWKKQDIGKSMISEKVGDQKKGRKKQEIEKSL